MPVPDYGVMQETIVPGDYSAVISKVISIGTQTTKTGKELKKYYIEFFIPELNISKPLSNFGIANFKSKSQYPFVGLYELISAVLKTTDPTNEEMAEYNVYDLAGKSVKVSIEEVRGYSVITGVLATEDKIVYEEETIAYDITEAIAADNLGTLDKKVSKLIRDSKEYNVFDSPVTSPVATDQVSMDGTVSELSKDKELRLEDVPF